MGELWPRVVSTVLNRIVYDPLTPAAMKVDGKVRRDRRFPSGLGRTLRGGKEANMCPWKIWQLCTCGIICLELAYISIEIRYCKEMCVSISGGMCVVNLSVFRGSQCCTRTVPLWFGLGRLVSEIRAETLLLQGNLEVGPSLRWIVAAKTHWASNWMQFSVPLRSGFDPDLYGKSIGQIRTDVLKVLKSQMTIGHPKRLWVTTRVPLGRGDTYRVQHVDKEHPMLQYLTIRSQHCRARSTAIRVTGNLVWWVW